MQHGFDCFLMQIYKKYFCSKLIASKSLPALIDYFKRLFFRKQTARGIRLIKVVIEVRKFIQTNSGASNTTFPDSTSTCGKKSFLKGKLSIFWKPTGMKLSKNSISIAVAEPRLKTLIILPISCFCKLKTFYHQK